MTEKSIYGGMTIEGYGELTRQPGVGDGNWYKTSGEVWIHIMEVDGSMYVDGMQVNTRSPSLWDKIRKVFK